MSGNNCISVQTLINQINTSIKALGSQQTNTSNFPNTKGTYNNLTLLNNVISSNGKTGNTTSDGYYATYFVVLTNLTNVIDFYIDEANDYDLCFTRSEQSQKYTLNLTYNSDVSASGNYDATAKVYAPSYCDAGFVTKGKGWDLKTVWSKCAWDVPSTYKDVEPFKIDGGCGAKINNCTGTTNVKFSYGSEPPTGDYTFITYEIDGLPTEFKYYIYNFDIESLNIYFTSYSIDISGLKDNSNAIVNSFTASDVQSAVQNEVVPVILKAVNDAINNICIILTGSGINI